MNKAFVRESEPDGTAYCPSCGTLGTPVGKSTLDHHVTVESRMNIGEGAWFCSFAKCDIAYFDLFDRVVAVSELQHPIYPKDPSAPICPCFGFTLDNMNRAIQQRSPESIRELLTKSKSISANCKILAADGRCCMQEVQRLYIRGVGLR